MEYRQDPPFSLQVELTEGCSLACEFCGINGIREMPGNFKFMTGETMDNLTQKLKDAEWLPRVEFAMHGEPSMHPHMIDAITLFRQRLGPKASLVMFSNGSGFLANTSERINGLLEAGLNTLGLDAYEHVNIVPKVMAAYDGKYPVHHYPLEIDQNLHSGRRVGHRDIVVIKDISVAKAGNHSTLNTHCGGGKEPDFEPLKKRCAKPFRELSIRWDGNVAISCNDFRGVYKIGNINDTDLIELWNHPRFMAARKKLMLGERDFDPCRFCNATSMRVGLLPDHKGLWELGALNAEDERHLKEAVEGAPYTQPVLRKWEVGGKRKSFPVIDAMIYKHNSIPDDPASAKKVTE